MTTTEGFVGGTSITRPTRPRRAMLAVAVAFALLFIGASLAASNGLAVPIMRLVHAVPGGDLLAHGVITGALAFACGMVFLGADDARRPRRAAIILIVLITLTTIDEASQFFLSRRTCSPFDLAANILGIATGTWLSLRLLRTSP